jgi:hypothetical protein
MRISESVRTASSIVGSLMRGQNCRSDYPPRLLRLTRSTTAAAGECLMSGLGEPVPVGLR